MTTLGEFYSTVSAELRRGTSFDLVIPARVQIAISWMEKQHTFLHMEKFSSVPILMGNRSLGLPAGFKSMKFWRLLKEDGSFRDLVKIHPADMSSLNTGMPSAYWQNAKFETWFDAVPDKSYNTERCYIGYSVLGGVEDSPEVLQLYQQVIFHQTCVLMSTILRDGDFGGAHKGLRDEAMKAAIDADVEERQSAESPYSMYGHEFLEQVNEDNQS